MHHHNSLHYLLKNELNELYISVSIRFFVISMISIFIPIYLLKLGYPLKTVFLFYALLYFVHAILVIPVAKLGSKIGFKHLILLSTPLLISYFILLYTLPEYHWPIYGLAVLLGVKYSLFHTGLQVTFSKFSHKKSRGQELARLSIFRTLLSAAGPFLGGLVLTFLGFKALFIFGSILLVFSVIPLLYAKDTYGMSKFKIKDIFQKRKKRDLFGFIGFGLEAGVSHIVWPVFLFLTIVESYSILGLIATVSILFSVGFIYLAGKFSDINRRLVLKVGAIITTVIYFIKAVISTVLQAFLVDSLHGMGKTLAGVSFGALSFDKAKKDVRYIIFREVSINLSIAFLFVIMSFISNLIIGFFIGSFGSLLMLFF
jgi:MFS family permease